jgi:transposase
MGRPPEADSGFRVSIHIANGYRYASTQPAINDDNDGVKKHRHVHWGRVDENNKFSPGRAYILASPEERAKLIFPNGWDLSAIEQLSGARKRGRPSYNGRDLNRFYGDIWLLEQLADKLGIRQDLMKVFDGNGEIVDDIITLAIFPMITEFSCRRLPRWQLIAKSPSNQKLTPPYVTRFTQQITEQHRMDLLRLRAARLGKEEILAVDSTSRSAYGDSLADTHWGKNKNHLPLQQTVEVVAYTLTSHMPVYYRTFPGNIPDSRTLGVILTDLEHAGFRNTILVTDRGYESIRNLEVYILKEQAMVMCTKVQQCFVSEKINAFGAFDGRPDEMEIDPKAQIYYKQYDIEYEVNSTGTSSKKATALKLNLYLDSVRRSAELVCLDSEVKLQEAEIRKLAEEETPCDDDVTLRRNFNYYKIVYDPATRIIKSYERDEKKIAKARRLAGFFAITTQKLDFDAMETYSHYRLRDEQEKYFQQMKGRLGFDKQQNWSEEGKTGRLLILFISLMLTSYIRHIWKTTELKNLFESSLDILDEMRPIRCVEHTNRVKVITPFVGAQVDICKAFDVEIPEGCAPNYVSKRKFKRKRGRPRKPATEYNA